MTNGLIYMILNASLAGSILAVFAWLLHRWFPRVITIRVAYALWLLVALRLVLPFCPESQFSALNLMPPSWAHKQLEPAPSAENDSETKVTFITRTGTKPFALLPATHNESIRQAPINRHFGEWVTLLWGTVAFTLIALSIMQMWKTSCLAGMADFDVPAWLTKLKGESANALGVTNKIPVGISAEIPVPAIVGIWNQRILIPDWCFQTMTHDQIRLILIHELVHAKRRDVLVQFVVSLIRIVHWFNPLATVMQRRICQLHELRCDAAVVGHTGGDSATVREYGTTLLQIAERCCATKKQPSLANGFVGVLRSEVHESCLHERIHMLANKKMSSKLVGPVATIIVTGIVLCGFTTAQTQEASQSDLPLRTDKVGKLLPGLPQDGELLPGLPQDGELLPGLVRDGELLPGLPRDGELLPGLPRDGELLPGLPRDAELLPGLPRDGELLPGLPRDGELLPGLPRDAELLPGLPPSKEINGTLVEIFTHTDGSQVAIPLQKDETGIVRVDVDECLEVVESWQPREAKFIAYHIEIYKGSPDDAASFVKQLFNHENAIAPSIEKDQGVIGFCTLQNYTKEVRLEVAVESSLTVMHAPTLVASPGDEAEIFTGSKIPFANVKEDEDGNLIPTVDLIDEGLKLSIQSRFAKDGSLVSFLDLTVSKIDGTMMPSLTVNELVVQRPQVLRCQWQTTTKTEFGVPVGINFESTHDESRIIVMTAQRMAKIRSR